MIIAREVGSLGLYESDLNPSSLFRQSTGLKSRGRNTVLVQCKTCFGKSINTTPRAMNMLTVIPIKV